MSIRFAPAGNGECSVVARIRICPPLCRADNDVDHASLAPICRDALLVSALRHFAVHGLNAAREASRLAEHARRQGDQGQYKHWLGVCRHLDQRMAARIAACIVPPARHGGR